MRSLRPLALFLAAALAIGACDSPTSAKSIEETEFASTLGVDLAASTKTATGLYFRDLAVGTGALVQTGTRVNVYYVGYFADARVFDQRIPGQTPFAFTVGVDPVIDGWHEGVAGMRVGGRRQLIIPPSLGYGKDDYGPIPGNSILVFNIEVVSIG